MQVHDSGRDKHHETRMQPLHPPAGSLVGPALLSFNRIESEAQAVNVMSRNPDVYRTWNLKEYRTGNCEQREWVFAGDSKAAPADHDWGCG
jgi:hypothetical protein